MSIYDFDHYVNYLRALIQDLDSPISVRELAEAADVQRSYLSNILADKAQLNREQGYRLGSYLGMDEAELCYFLNLIEIQRAGFSKYQAYLKKKAVSMKKDSEQLKNKLNRSPLDLAQDIATEYFSCWEYSAVHLLTSIPEFRTLRKISKSLHLTPREVQYFTDKLMEWSLIEKTKEGFGWISGNIHIQADSPVARLHQRNWRERALENSKINDEKSIHFTSVYSMSHSDAKKARSKILKVIKEYSEQASISKEEALVCFNVDFFDLTGDVV
jgi:uncharacterized protein (TIGR02147 family)